MQPAHFFDSPSEHQPDSQTVQVARSKRDIQRRFSFYNSETRSTAIFPNNKCFRLFEHAAISETIIQCLANGSLLIKGRVESREECMDEVDPPPPLILVMLITVESPSPECATISVSSICELVICSLF